MNGHKTSLFYDGINQNKPSYVNYLKIIIFNIVLNIFSVFIVAIVAALRMSRCRNVREICGIQVSYFLVNEVTLLLTLL